MGRWLLLLTGRQCCKTVVLFRLLDACSAFPIRTPRGPFIEHDTLILRLREREKAKNREHAPQAEFQDLM